jgi:hypothetical protein
MAILYLLCRQIAAPLATKTAWSYGLSRREGAGIVLGDTVIRDVSFAVAVELSLSRP